MMAATADLEARKEISWATTEATEAQEVRGALPGPLEAEVEVLEATRA